MSQPGALIPTSVKEAQSLGDSLTHVGAVDSLGNMPVTVISSDKWVDPDAAIAAKRAEWNKRQQRNWLAISTNSSFLIVPWADHMSLLSNKEHAAAVTDSIVKMVKTVKEHMRSLGRTTRHQSPPAAILCGVVSDGAALVRAEPKLTDFRKLPSF